LPAWLNRKSKKASKTLVGQGNKYFLIFRGGEPKLLIIENLRNLCHDENMAMTKHANNRIRERGIGIEDIKHAIKIGEIIRQYEDDKPFPSCLLLGKAEDGEYIHLVASIDADTLYIITAYHPDETEWESDLKSKRRL
jgi:hypothetical protein